MQWNQRDGIHSEAEDHLTGYVPELENKLSGGGICSVTDITL